MRPLPVLARVLPAHPARPVGRIGDEVLQSRRFFVLSRGCRTSCARRRRAFAAPRRTDSPRSHCRSRRSCRPGVQPGPRRISRPAQFRADDEQVHAAGDRAEVRVVQDHPAIGPIEQVAGIGDRQIDRIGREFDDRRRPHEGRRPRRRCAREIVRRSDAPAPGIARRRPEQERIEDDLEASGFEVADAAHDRRVARRAAVDEISRSGQVTGSG